MIMLLMTPNNLWGVTKANLQEKLHFPVVSFLGKFHWRNKFHLGCTRKFLGSELCNPRGPNGKLKKNLVDVSDIFSARRREKGSPRRRDRGRTISY